MDEKKRRRLYSIFLTMLFFISLTTTAYAAISPQGIDNAFAPDWSDSISSYEDAFGWDSSKFMARTWIGDDGVQYERQTGWQKDYYENNIQTTQEYLGIYGGLGGIGGIGGGGGSIVSVALGELGKEDSLELPAGSNYCKYNDWYYGRHQDAAWCAIFVCWCANECGYLDSIIPKTASCTIMFRKMVSDYGYSAYPVLSTTPFGGSAYTPVPGDLMFFSSSGDLSADDPFEHIGIIVEVEDNGWYTVEGNTTGSGQIPGGGVAKNHYLSSTGLTSARNGYVVHVEYPAMSGSDNFAITYNFLVGVMGFNSAAACGIMANMNAESAGIQPDVNEIGGGGGYGICQWTGSRRDNLVAWCNQNGYDYTTLEGQLWFFEYEIRTIASTLLLNLKNIDNTAQGAYDAAADFCRLFEKPRDTERAAAIRGQSAQNDFWPLYQNLAVAK